MADLTKYEKAAVVRQVADEIEAQYPPDIFIPPTRERIAQMREVLEREGMTLDAFSTHVMRHACYVMRWHADQIANGVEDDG